MRICVRVCVWKWEISLREKCLCPHLHVPIPCVPCFQTSTSHCQTVTSIFSHKVWH